MQFLHGTNINFVSKRTIFFVVSLILNVIGIAFALFVKIDYGIDFVGGTEIAYNFERAVHTDAIRKAVEATGIKGAEIKSYGKDNQYLIRIKSHGDATDKINASFKSAFPDIKTTVIKEDKIGPKIGAELRFQAFMAVGLACIAILLYIAFRFEFIYGLGAVIALIHDVLVTFAFVMIAHKTHLIDLEVNQQMLAAFLTVIGFSVNDTVIIFDRIREHKFKQVGFNFLKVVNMSINETLSRTINTVLTVVIVLLTMVVLGGPVLQGFSFTMLIGIITGTYSSIYIASSYVLWHLEKVKKVKFEHDFTKIDSKENLVHL